MSAKSYSILIVLVFTLAFAGFAQEKTQRSRSPKAERLYQRALGFYAEKDLKRAQLFAEKAIRTDEQFIQAYLLTGDILFDLNEKNSAISYYENALRIDPDFYPPVNYILGNLYYNSGNYAAALERFEYYSKFTLRDEERNILGRRTESAKAAKDLKNNPVPFEPVNLCFNINTASDEYVNAVSADGETLIFTVRSPLEKPERGRQFREKFFMSNLENSTWSKAVPMQYLSDNPENEGALTLSYDNRNIFFTSCHLPDGYGSCDLYFSSRQGEGWTKPQNLGPVVNSSRWESQASLSPDGKTLYFASNRSGGLGGSDIWKTILKENGEWQTPENIGPEINTAEDEMSPFIHADGKTLYFSSKGLPGLGGADLFVSRLNADGHWEKPVNLGYPINTLADEINLIVHPNGKSAFISSDLPGGKGGYDIYVFELHDAIKPLPVSYLKGIVRDANTSRPLAASIELIELESGRTTITSRSDAQNGEFIAVLPVGSDYALHVNRKDYLFYSHHFALQSAVGLFDPVVMDIFLKPVEYGQVVILKNVFFAHNSFELENNSGVELNRLAVLLRENPELKLEISGHTDNTGTGVYNQTLSTNRARSVYEYLVKTGIRSERLNYKGMGDTNPVDTNNTPEGRANNRRTEIRIVN